MRVAHARGQTVQVKIPRGRLTAKKPILLAGQTVGVAAADQDVLIAVDASKSYVVYETECTGYAIVESGTQDDDRCRRDVQNPNARQPDGEETCKRCLRVVAWIDRGGVWRDAPSSGQAERNPGRNPLTRPAVLLPIGAAAAGGAYLAMRGGSEAAPPFSGLVNSTFQLNSLQGNNGCPGFTATAVATMTFSPDQTTGIGPLRVQYTGSSTEYPNARAVAEGANFVVTAAGASVVTPTRSFTADLTATVSTGGVVRVFEQVFRQLNGAGAPCNQVYRQ
jgi:hypothetical protein